MPKIAVLDDDEHWCFLLQRFLQSDFDVYTFQSLFDLLPKIEQFHLIVIDFSIPPNQYQENIDGCGIIQRIKEKYQNPPILVLATAFISRKNPELGREICPEADYFIAKDSGLEIVSASIRHLLSSRLLGC